jgi:hypothetical protein
LAIIVPNTIAVALHFLHYNFIRRHAMLRISPESRRHRSHVDDGSTGRIDRPARSGHESSQPMIARMKSVLTRQIFSGYASFYLSIIASLLVSIAILGGLVGMTRSLRRNVEISTLIVVPFLFAISFSLALTVVLEPPIFRRQKRVLFRIAMSVCIGFAAVVSWLTYLALTW